MLGMEGVSTLRFRSHFCLECLQVCKVIQRELTPSKMIKCSKSKGANTFLDCKWDKDSECTSLCENVHILIMQDFALNLLRKYNKILWLSSFWFHFRYFYEQDTCI